MNKSNLLPPNDRLIIQDAVGRLCNALRIFLEEYLRFQKLFKIDKEEAITNCDRSFESILESFHTLYDVSKKYLNFFESAETSLLITLRNAIHHRNHNLFKSLQSEFLLQEYQQIPKTKFLLCSYKPVDNGAFVMQYHYRLEDILDRLDSTRNSPYLDVYLNEFKRKNQLQLLNNDLGFSKILEYSKHQNFSLDEVYINIPPILNGALRKVFTNLLNMGLTHIGHDDGIYLNHFTTEGFFHFDQLIFESIQIN